MTLIPTYQLRLLQSNRSDAEPPVLQQRFTGANGFTEYWINVPIVNDATQTESKGESI